MMENYTVRQADLERVTSMLQELNNPDGDLHVTLLVDPKIGPEGLVIEPGSEMARMMDTLPGESRPWYENESPNDGESTFAPPEMWDTGPRLPGGGTFKGMAMMVQYHFIYVKTLTERTALETTDFDLGQPDPNDLDAPYVTATPDAGAVIMVRSDWGPVKVTVAISEDASPVPADSPWSTGPVADVVSAPDLAHLDRDWQRVITLRDSAFDIYTFDDCLPDHALKRAGEHQVAISWRYDHSRTIDNEYDPTPYQEYVTIRFANPGETG